MKFKNGKPLYAAFTNQLFDIVYIAHNAKEANQFCANNPGNGVIEELENGIVVIASIKQSTFGS